MIDDFEAFLMLNYRRAKLLTVSAPPPPHPHLQGNIRFSMIIYDRPAPSSDGKVKVFLIADVACS